MNWLIKENFTSHAGKELAWKIDCDHLTNVEIGVFAYLIARHYQDYTFGKIIGIPTGGERLAHTLISYLRLDSVSKNILIVDDVFTTGMSMETEMEKNYNSDGFIYGAVMFSRTPCPTWIWPVFSFFEYPKRD